MAIRIIKENTNNTKTDPYITDYAHPTKLLSILCQGRNDNYMGNFSWRIATAINNHARNIFTLGLENEVEVLVADWGSERPFFHDLDLTSEAKKVVKYLIVPPKIAEIYDKDSGFAAPQPTNALTRRSNGKYLLFSDSDIFIPLASMAKLISGIKSGYIGNYKTDETFFWSSKLHIPYDLVMQNPSLKEIDQDIEKNWQSYTPEKVSKEYFQGCGVCMLMKREMWLDSRGWDERLIYWGWNDIDWHRRLEWKYKWEDLEEQGMKMFHLEHYKSRFKDFNKELKRKANPQIDPTEFCPNANNWGLGDQNLTFLDGYGLKINPNKRISNYDEIINFNNYSNLKNVKEILNTSKIFKNDLTPIIEKTAVNKEYLNAICQKLLPKVICDIGTALGNSTAYLASQLSTEKVVSVSHWIKDRFINSEELPNFVFEQFLNNMNTSNFAHKIYPLLNNVELTRKNLLKEDVKFDLIYCNEDIPEKLLQEFLKNWSPLLTENGIICGNGWAFTNDNKVELNNPSHI